MQVNHMRIITDADIAALIEQAAYLPRRRAMLRLHQHEEPVQRMVNALLPGTYIPPHKHEDPDKVELFTILVGRVACLHLNTVGQIEKVLLLEEAGPVRVVDIPPRTYHTLIALEPSALLEIIQGPYEAASHKQLAPWAPDEDSLKAPDYLMYLESIVHNWDGASR